MAADDIGLNYATAFIDSLKTPAEIQKAGEDLDLFCGLLKELPALSRILENPGLLIGKRLSILDEALAAIDPLATSRRFLHIVVRNKRVGQMKSIQTRFSGLHDARLGLVGAEMVSAAPVDPKTRSEWEDAVVRLTGKKLRVTHRADASVMGGGVTRVGSVVYDGSIRKQLERIRGILLGE